jgi:hypothetical protein
LRTPIVVQKEFASMSSPGLYSQTPLSFGGLDESRTMAIYNVDENFLGGLCWHVERVCVREASGYEISNAELLSALIKLSRTPALPGDLDPTFEDNVINPEVTFFKGSAVWPKPTGIGATV